VFCQPYFVYRAPGCEKKVAEIADYEHARIIAHQVDKFVSLSVRISINNRSRVERRENPILAGLDSDFPPVFLMLFYGKESKLFSEYTRLRS